MADKVVLQTLERIMIILNPGALCVKFTISISWPSDVREEEEEENEVNRS